eukprot:Hpha_TRINITY_DN15328_c2_g1::TRINITY_DN15328_c2_g1_i1::g.88147::m.88147
MATPNRLHEAQDQDRALNKGAEESFSPPAGKPSGFDYDNILPVGYDPHAPPPAKGDTSTDGAVVVTSPSTAGVTAPVEGRLKGKQVQYYQSEQAQQNLMLQAAVAENEELLNTLHELQGEQVSNARALLATRNRNRAERVRDYDEGYRWPDASQYNAAQLVLDFGLKLSIEELQELGEMRHPQLAACFAVLEELLTKRAPAARRAVMDAEIGPLVKAYMQKASHPDLHGQSVRMHEFVHTDVFQYIKQELARSGDRMKLLHAELDLAEEKKAEALQTDDIVEADEQHRKSVALLEALIAAVQERLKQINLSSEDGGSFRGRFEQFKQALEQEMKDVRDDKDKLKANILSDLSSLATRGEKMAKENEQALVDYANYQRESNTNLNDNAHRQDQLWEQIQEMVHEMKVLGDKRFVEVNKHLRATEAEEKRKREYAEFSEVFAEHCRRMEELLQNTDTALRLLDAYGEFFVKGYEAVDAKGCEEELYDIRLTEMKRYLAYYRRYALVAGDLIIRRKARLTGLERQARTTDAQLRLCVEALDPQKVHYKEELRRLNAQLADVQTNYDDLVGRFDEHEKSFQPIEDQLEELGEDFVPPKVEYSEFESGKRAQHLSLTKELVQAEQDEVDTEQRKINNLNTKTRLKIEDTVKKRENRKAKSPPRHG